MRMLNRSNFRILSHDDAIGANLSEPHTSESNDGFFIYYYIYIYLPYVRRSVNAN